MAMGQKYLVEEVGSKVRVTSIEPARVPASGGTEVTLRGAGFDRGIDVGLTGEAANLDARAMGKRKGHPGAGTSASRGGVNAHIVSKNAPAGREAPRPVLHQVKTDNLTAKRIKGTDRGAQEGSQSMPGTCSGKPKPGA